MSVDTFFTMKTAQLMDVMQRVAKAFDGAGIPYQVIGGMAIYLRVDAIDPIAARMTRDIDVAIGRQDLERLRTAIEPYGLRFRHVAGVDMLVDANEPKARSAIHLIMAGEKVRRDYVEPAPAVTNPETLEGVKIAPVIDLVKMKLTSFRLKDKVHIQDLDGVGLITPEIEQALGPILLERLAEVRATL